MSGGREQELLKITGQCGSATGSISLILEGRLARIIHDERKHAGWTADRVCPNP